MNIYHNPLIIFVIINNFFDYFVHGMRARSEGPISPLGKKRLLVIMSWPQVPPLYFQLYSNNHKTTKSARFLSFGFWRVSKKRQKLLGSSLSVKWPDFDLMWYDIYLDRDQNYLILHFVLQFKGTNSKCEICTLCIVVTFIME